MDFKGEEDSAQALTTMLQINKTLSHLDLSRNWNFSDSGAYCVFQGLQHNTTLVHLNLSHTCLKVTSEDTAQAFTTMLRVNKTLTHINLSGNWNFSDSGAYCVFQGLQHNTALVHLNLCRTSLKATSEDTAQALTTMLRVNKTLTHLDLSENQTFLESFQVVNCMCAGLQHNTTLRHLKLKNTGIKDNAELQICQAMNCNLTHDITLNRFQCNIM